MGITLVRNSVNLIKYEMGKEDWRWLKDTINKTSSYHQYEYHKVLYVYYKLKVKHKLFWNPERQKR